MEQNHSKEILFAAVALVIGLAGGYFYGHSKGIAREKANQEALAQATADDAAKAVNPFEQASVNPYENAVPNPYDQVQVNPFK